MPAAETPASGAAAPTAAAAAALSADGLEVRFGDQPALAGVTLEIPARARVAVLGPNGAGKSTLFKAALGLVGVAAGTIEIRARSAAFVPQDVELEPQFPVTALDVVRMGRYGELGWWRRFSERDHQLVAGAMDSLGVTDLSDRRFGELSGGQRQRVLLAQAAAQDAELVLLDEPLTGVDAPTASKLQALLDAWSSQGRTVMVATHDLRSARQDFDLVLCLNRTVIAYGPPAEVLTEQVLADTFRGQLFKLGDLLVEVAHHDHGSHDHGSHDHSHHDHGGGHPQGSGGP